MDANRRKRNQGFTLVELMIVVAIIGILASIAVPNFRKYQAKSRTSEAKLQLSSLYSAMAAFQAEFSVYSTCLSYMGYDPTEEVADRYYAVGFAAAAANHNGTIDGASGCNDGTDVNSDGSADTWGFPAGKTIGGFTAATAANLATDDVPPAAGTNFLQYTAASAGKITTDRDVLDRWTINETKDIEHVATGY